MINVKGEKRFIFLYPVFLLILTLLFACDADVLKFGHKKGSSQPAIAGEPVEAPFMTVIPQFVPPLDGDGGAFPGAANYWDLTPYFALSDGFDDQFDDALVLTVTVNQDTPLTESFPSVTTADIQTYSPIISLSNFPGAENGIVSDGGDSGWSPLSGSYSAYILATPDSRLSQVIDLTTAVAPVTVSWNDSFDIYQNFPDENNTYNVVLRDTSGNLLTTLFTSSNTSGGGSHSVDISSYAGQQVVLSFEFSSYAHW
ncbi:MAG: hypothetical protein D6713_04120, partial [Deltaproteobacteria bacterium]